MRTVLLLKFMLCTCVCHFVVAAVLVYHPLICVGGVYMIRSVPHPVISVECQLIGSMLVVVVLYQ